MGVGRKDALKRIHGLAFRVEKHLEKIANDPENIAVPHWRHETTIWLGQMEDVLSEVGLRTGAEWSIRISAWKARLGV